VEQGEFVILPKGKHWKNLKIASSVKAQEPTIHKKRLSSIITKGITKTIAEN
jgi:hypothetical protein